MAKEEESLVAYCGLYCGDCANHKGKIADLARDLRKELRLAKMKRIAKGLSKYFKQFKNYDQYYEFLGMMVRFRCKRTCRNLGGPPHCKIRMCCQKKDIEGCWLCEEFELCKKLDFLRALHADGHMKNIRIIKKKGLAEFLKGKRYW